MSRSRSATASLAVAAALVGVALIARGGSVLHRTALAEILLIAAGAALVCAAVTVGPRGAVRGGPAVAAFAALAALTLLSERWSIAPDLSQVEAGRTLAYLATFGGAVALGRLLRGEAAAAARGVLIAAVAICAYGLAARVWPASFDELAFTGRIGQPFDYWNALAGMGALGLVPALWLGARRAGAAAATALAFPAAGLLLTTVLLAQSRGALLGAAVAVALWLVFVPLRLRSLVVLAVAAVGAAPVAAWAVGQDPFKLGLQPLEAREAVAGEFGLLLAAMIAGLTAAGAVYVAVGARWQPPEGLRRRVGATAVAVAVAIPLIGLGAVAASDRGLTGTLSDRWAELTSESAAPPAGGERLGSVASERASYWREAFDVFAEDRLTGHGAGSFELARLAHRTDGGVAARAHGFAPQTLADLGLLGAAAALALLAAWLVAALRATALQPRRWWRAPAGPRPQWSDERTALAALALAAVAYGTQGATDWTWFVPGLTATALVAAGFVAGHGPLPNAPVPASLPTSGEEDIPDDIRRQSPSHPPAGEGTGPRIAICVATVAAAALFAWIAWQPVGPADDADAAFARLADGDPAGALALAAEARRDDPDLPAALYAIAAAYRDVGRDRSALATLRIAAAERPRDPQPWRQIAGLELDVRGRPAAAQAAAQEALARDPYSRAARELYDRATQALTASPGSG